MFLFPFLFSSCCNFNACCDFIPIPTCWSCFLLIDTNLEKSLALEELKDALRKSGCEVKHRTHLAVKIPQGRRFIRCDSLGDGYTEHELLKRLGCEQIVKPIAKKKAFSSAGKKPHLLINIEAKLQQGKGVGYEKRAKTFNLKESVKTLIYLQEHGLDDYEILSAKADDAAHESDILLHKGAKQEFDKLGLEKLPSMDALKKEYAMLFSQKNQLYGEYRQARQEMVVLQMA